MHRHAVKVSGNIYYRTMLVSRYLWSRRFRTYCTRCARAVSLENAEITNIYCQQSFGKRFTVWRYRQAGEVHVMFQQERPVFDLLTGIIDPSSSDDEQGDKVKKFIENARATETKRKMDFWVSRFRQHIHATGKDKDIIDMDKKELNDAMCSFLIDTKKKDGTSYETSTINHFFAIINRHMKDNNLGNLETDAEFQTARNVKRAKLKVLKADGKGNRPNRSAAISREEEDKLYETGQLGYSTPMSLLRTVWMLTTMLFGHRGRNESRQMLWGDVKLKKDENGREYLEFNERLTKTRDGSGEGGSRPFCPKAFENRETPERCPVTAYKEYAKRRPTGMLDPASPFYLAVNHQRKADDPVWFKSGPLGVNSISSLMKDACTAAGIPGRKTNHSVRKTCVKRALDAGCPREYVAQITGHKSVRSIENYAEADVHVQRAISSSIMTGTAFASSADGAAGASAHTSVSSSAPCVININNCNSVNIYK